MTAPIRGTAHTMGHHIDTDAIIPATYLVSTDPIELGKYCMAGMDPDWVNHVEEGDIIVAGENFGCGSSREHAPIAIIGAGVKAVIAKSFARIFYRNAFNMGLLLLEVGDAVDKISQGDTLSIDPAAGTITDETTGESFKFAPVPPFMQEILNKGGLVGYVSDRLESQAG
ncbi:3-isopropylmalate dehydratase small subunit [Oceanidesulfovibrio marinus]|uniref:3-isopropylmalate dehydratase small subunit n=1 Tax=Oceanidesulfovibrio marinus TaxID=370038 RepID=A0A6P1ZJS0_9BACT|nr:3-isopropylmalate dehydratase small subunit [Oceanidesulfovibrio marinus]QJT10581.1 3-isopropylmalate dehydratase small subunit [Oceanidesulfovibrio marinus]TVM34187.1 3-isopropylmalate dehydratase small subunit [Oceanidesulfovibrio marinus]